MSSRLAARVALIVLLAVAAPACAKKKTKTPPDVIGRLPSGGAGSVSHWPLIILQFDQDMDPATINNTNVRLVNNANGSAVGSWAVTYFPGVRQALITPGAFLPESMVIDVTCTSSVMNVSGTPIALSDAGEVIENQFTVTSDATPATRIQPGFAQPTDPAAPGASTKVVHITWTEALESAVSMQGNYDVYFATSPGMVNMLGTSPISVSASGTNTTGADLTMAAADTQYYFIVVAHDNNGNVKVTNEIGGKSAP